MKKSRRLFRNTTFALAGLVVMYVLVSRLTAEDKGGGRSITVTPAAELAKLRDFSAITVNGDISVDVIQQAEYSVQLTAGPPEGRFNANVVDGMLNLRSFGNADVSRVRVGMPALAQLKANGRPALTVSGFGGDSIDLRLGEVSRVVLRNNSVRRWHIFASDVDELQIDRASIGAGKVDLVGRASLTVID